ncbi:L-dopachrome tautomerase-related protein [Acetobacter sp. DsW_063]|uniref:L-dopachrome tautomerase-related protein n=1 Tax=Acetobacter sp. DsW_063 TaxID=1514894 RepID=UPI000A35F449|nr:L-dopachrome tautomerase-related protein [Acetobacter sp. DsW_063]OUJ10991.1 gluconolactonase [Acetobacter sp. DsW_063]
MRRIWRSTRHSLLACAALLTAFGAAAADSVDHGSTPTSNVTVMGRFDLAQPSGIALLPDRRLVLAFPTSAQKHPGPVLATWSDRDGKLSPFPDVAAQKELVSPLGMTVDGNGQLWLVDEGLRADSTAKSHPALIHIDPASNRIVRRYALTEPVATPKTHVNDVRIDLTHGAQGTAFVTDTSFDGHPALMVIDLASGKGRRVLAGTRYVNADPDLVMEVDGRIAHYDAKHPTMAQGGLDGLTLSADSSRLYWSPLSARRLYSAPTAILADPTQSEAAIEASVKDEGEVGVMDGMATAPDGSLYLTDIERHAVLHRTPDGTLSIVAQDPRLIAPDGLALDGNSLWMTVGQWSRLPAFHDGRDMQERPYILVRITPLTPAPRAAQ